MLPLEQNNLTSDVDWHAFKSILITCRHCSSPEAKTTFRKLPQHLQTHRHGVRICSFLETRDQAILDAVAVELTQRDASDAWILLERL